MYLRNFSVPILLFAFFLTATCNEKSQSQQQETAAPTTEALTISEVIDTDYGYELDLVAGDLEIPWGMVFVNEGILVGDKNGSIWMYTEPTVRTAIKGFPKVWSKGQGGLLDIELDPNYAEEPWIYFSYAKQDPANEDQGHTAISRAKLNGDTLIDWQELYYGEEVSDKGHHFGSRLEFDDDGLLYFSIGDRGDRDNNPQDITRDAGKVYRINKDGSIPTDNPFASQEGAKKAIFSYGHRNAQGMIFHPTFKEIWVHEHGPQGGDEINVSEKGKNFGWPVISYGVNYDGSSFTELSEMEGMEQPLYYWVPSIAPSGMQWVTSAKYPELQNTLLVGSLKFQYLEALHFEGKRVVKRERIFKDVGRLRNVRQGPDGFIYIAVEGQGIYKVLSL
ncbi:MAG: PQQ-dependent sugar dehydrogenase [Bacteroidetes bacterium]|nr:PQQ-dependent sugar dehydrogenase [Bacteroidota bacterium]